MVDYLVTGCSGYVGSKIIDKLKSNSQAFIGIDKFAEVSKEFNKFNLTDRNKTLEILEKTKPKTIIHCGTFSAGRYKDDFLSSFKEDAIALSNILEHLKQNPEQRFIFFSSSYVYSGISSENICDENFPLNPTHNFGVAKLFFEKLILRCHNNSLVFRLSSVFGPGNQLQPTAIKNMIIQSINEDVIDIWGNGDRKMQYIYIEDVVQSVLDSNLLKPGIYNLGGNDYLSVSEAASIISKKTSSRMNYLKDKPEGFTLPFMSIDKLRNENPGKSPKDIKTALNNYVNKFI